MSYEKTACSTIRAGNNAIISLGGQCDIEVKTLHGEHHIKAEIKNVPHVTELDYSPISGTALAQKASRVFCSLFGASVLLNSSILAVATVGK